MSGVATPGPWLAVAAASLALSVLLAGRRWSRWWLSLVAVSSVAALGAAGDVLATGGEWELRGDALVGGELVHLRLDAVSGVFLVLVAVVGALAAAYAREYWSDEHHPATATRARAWWSGFLLSMGLVLVTSNGLHFLIAWEAFAICGYFLITLERGRREVRRAGWLYLVASHTGTLALVAFFSLLAARTGSWDLGPMHSAAGVSPLLWLAVFGFGLKAGFFPLHVWLPPAHANAPSHVSAIMSGVAIKMGLYGIIRFGGWLPLPANAGVVLMLVGSTSALLGIAFAFAQNDVKRLLAYCSVENVGIILVGVGAAMQAAAHGAPAWGRLALAGALLHVWNHGAFKSLLFLGAGSVVHATDTRDINRLGGLWKSLPWTAATFAVGALAVSALPPLNGFVSEWLVYLGLVDGMIAGGPGHWANGVAAVGLATAGAVTLATFVKASTLMFLGAPRTARAGLAHEGGPWMRVPQVVLAAVCVAIGLIPVLAWPLVSRAAASWNPTWAHTAAPSELVALTGTQLALGALAALAVALLSWRAAANGVARAPTWDCGFDRPTRRMQYTAGSFGAIVTGWFRWVLRPQAKHRRPRGVFPSGARWLEHFPDTILDRLIGPAGALVDQLSAASRGLQHGGSQSYILYVFAAVTLMGMFVFVAA